MSVSGARGTATLKASAKINLDLRIVGRRPDGFHELRTVFQTLALADVLTIRRARGPLRLEGSALGVPLDRSNLVWRAAAAAWRAAGERGPVRGVSIALEKRIPAAAGLGGGSSDAAATLVGVNRVLGLGLGPAELHRAAVSLGADVPFFLVGGTALGLGRGEDLFPLFDISPLHVVLVRPDFGVSTAAAYRWYAETANRGRVDFLKMSPHLEKIHPTPNLPLRWRAEGLALANDLERAVFPRHPQIAAAKRSLLRHGAVAALMAGSGSTVFGLFDDRGRADAARRALSRPGRTVWITRTLGRAAHKRRLAVGTEP